MLIPIFKPGDVLLSKNYPDIGKFLVLGSRTKSETTEYTTDMDIGGGVTRHEIKTSEWTEYDVLSKDFQFGNAAEDDLVKWYRRVSHIDLPSNFVEADSNEKDEEIRNARKAIEFYKDQLKDRRRDIRILQGKVEEDKDDYVKLIAENEKLEIRIKELRTCLNKKTEEVESRSLFWKRACDERDKVIDDLNDQLKMAYGCIDRFTIDAVAGMRRAGCSVEKIAKTLNMPEQAVKVYLNAADILDCKEDE